MSGTGLQKTMSVDLKPSFVESRFLLVVGRQNANVTINSKQKNQTVSK